MNAVPTAKNTLAQGQCTLRPQGLEIFHSSALAI